MNIVPPKRPSLSLRTRVLSMLVCAGLGIVVGLIGWLVTGEVDWLYAIPICAIIGWHACDERINVRWGSRVR